MNKLSLAMIHHANAVSRDLDAKALLVIADALESPEEEIVELMRAVDTRVVLVTRERELPELSTFSQLSVISVPKVPLTRMAQIKIAVLLGVAEKLLERGDVIVCLAGVQNSDRLDIMAVIKVGDEPEYFLTDESNPLPPDVQPPVFERLLTISSELAVEGREKGPVGLIFVVGDSDKVLENSRQLVFNPFRGYSDAERNILTGDLDETLKEFAAIDGAFIVRGDGVVLAAGRYLMPKGKPAEPLRAGLGTRHSAAAAITAVTDAVAIVLSQSTSTITVFNSGRVMTEIEKIRGGGERWIRSPRAMDGDS